MALTMDGESRTSFWPMPPLGAEALLQAVETAGRERLPLQSLKLQDHWKSPRRSGVGPVPVLPRPGLWVVWRHEQLERLLTTVSP
jgi:hypothetical protein